MSPLRNAHSQTAKSSSYMQTITDVGTKTVHKTDVYYDKKVGSYFL